MKINLDFWKFKEIDCSNCAQSKYKRNCPECYGSAKFMVTEPFYDRILKVRKTYSFVLITAGENKGKYKGPNNNIYTTKQKVGFEGNAKKDLLSKEEKPKTFQ